MKERRALARPHQAGDVAATAFLPNYAYFHEDGLTMYFEPSIIPALRVVYPGQGVEATPGQVVMSQAAANRLKAALAEVLDLCRERLENPYVPPAPQPAVAPGAQNNGNGGNK